MEIVVANFVLQWPGQLKIRSEAGHGEDGLLALRVARAMGASGSVPIVVSPAIGSVVMATIAPQVPGVFALARIDPNSRNIWPVRRSSAQVAVALAGAQKVMWLYRRSVSLASETRGGVPIDMLGLVTPSQPKQLIALGYHIESAKLVSDGWILVTLTKP